MKSIVVAALVMLLSSVGHPALAQEVDASVEKSTGKSQAGRIFDAQAEASQGPGRETASASEMPIGETLSPPVKRILRLPRYFSTLVSKEQREEIYEIQTKYMERLQQLQAQLDSLRAEEMEMCEQVLDATQRERLVEMRELAMERAKARSAAMMSDRSRTPSRPAAVTEGEGSQGGAESDTQ